MAKNAQNLLPGQLDPTQPHATHPPLNQHNTLRPRPLCTALAYSRHTSTVRGNTCNASPHLIPHLARRRTTVARPNGPLPWFLARETYSRHAEKPCRHAGTGATCPSGTAAHRGGNLITQGPAAYEGTGLRRALDPSTLSGYMHATRNHGTPNKAISCFLLV